MSVPLRLTVLRIWPEELDAIRRAVEAEAGGAEWREAGGAEALAALDWEERDLLLAAHGAGVGDAGEWLGLLPGLGSPPAIVLCGEEDPGQLDRLRRAGAFAVIPRGHPLCLIQSIRLAAGASLLAPAAGMVPEMAGPTPQRRMAGLMRVIGHNLRDVLGGITNAVEVLSFQRDPGALTQQRALALLDRQCRLMAGLLDDYSEIARYESGMPPGPREVVELGALLGRAIDRARMEAGEGPIAMERARRHEPLWVRVEARRLEHLVRHALHYCRRAEPGCDRIVVDWRRGPGRLELVIESMRGAVGHPPPREGQPIDLDLFLASLLVDRMGGLLVPGPPFVIELPDPAVGEPVGDDTADGPGSGTWRPEAGGHVLLIDDAPGSVRGLGLLIGRLGWHVRVTPDVGEAMAMLRRLRPEAVLIGLQLPGEDGASLAMRIRREQPASPPLLIGIGSEAESASLDRQGAPPFDHLLTKPVRWGELAALIGTPRRPAASG